jgi:hypothetical protein
MKRVRHRLLSLLAPFGLCLLLLAGPGPTRAETAETPERLLQSLAPLLSAGADLWREVQAAGRETGADAGAPLLARWIETARSDAVTAGTRPIPPEIRAQLIGFVSPSLMDRVRYRIGWPEHRALSGGVFRRLRIRAVALGDVLVFRDPAIAADAAIWVHELVHVRQYERWGTAGFARRYLRETDDVEAEAWDATARYRMWALEGRPAEHGGLDGRG